MNDGEIAVFEWLKIKSAAESPRMRTSACFTGCNALQSYCKKCGYQYMENVAMHLLPVLISRRLLPGAGVVVVVVVVVVVFAVVLVAVVWLEVAAVVELGSWPQLTTVTTWPKYLASVRKNKYVVFFSACWPQRSVRHEGDGRIFKILVGINVEYNTCTVRMQRHHNSVEQALSSDPLSSWASRRNILRFMEPKDSFPLKDLLCPRHQLPMMRTEMVLETLVYKTFNHLTRLLAPEYFIEFSCREKFKLFYSLPCSQKKKFSACLYSEPKWI